MCKQYTVWTSQRGHLSPTLTVKPGLEDSEHITLRLAEKEGTEWEKVRKHTPRGKTANISIYFIVQFKLFFFDLPSSSYVGETTTSWMSWRYIKVTELVELLWRLQSIDAALAASYINPQLREEKTKGANDVTLMTVTVDGTSEERGLVPEHFKICDLSVFVVFFLLWLLTLDLAVYTALLNCCSSHD